jgi:3'-phosphoadenosine 5'-phosphosulfate (PAPS) 3'-phosphatase
MNHKIKLTPRDETGRYFIIELDGVDISGFVRAVHISLIATETPTVTLELAPMEIEIPTELEAVVIAKKNGE